MNTQALLDSSDPTLAFAVKRDDVTPLALFRINQEEFLLCFKGSDSNNSL
jgi:hypothetical protein